MKKILLCTIMIVLGISLTGCGSNSKEKESDNNSSTNTIVDQTKNENNSNANSSKLEKNELIELTNEKVAVLNSDMTVRSMKNIIGESYHITDRNDSLLDTLIFEVTNKNNTEDDLNQDTKIFITTKGIEKNSVKLENIANELLNLRNKVVKLSYALQDTEHYSDWTVEESKAKIQGRDTIIQEGTLSCFGKEISNYVAYEFYLQDGTICEVYVSSPFYESAKLKETAEIIISTFEEQQQSAYS